MKGLVRALVISALLLLGAVAAPPGAADNPHTTTPGLPVQLGLGDSWAFGFGDTPGEGGYVPDLYETLKKDLNCLPTDTEQAGDGCKHLQLLNLAEGGETTPSMIEEQFPLAIPLLEARNLNRNPGDNVEVTTVHIGGNDVNGPILAACLGPNPETCLSTIQAELAQYQIDLTEALSELRGAAGDEAIVIGTYDNPFRNQLPSARCTLAQNPLAIALANLVLEGGPGDQGLRGLHDIMRSVGAQYDVQVADSFGHLTQPGDWFDCLHPTDSGYDKVVNAFEEVLGVGQSG
jgi:lysophospholipase L1-like esterase